MKRLLLLIFSLILFQACSTIEETADEAPEQEEDTVEVTDRQIREAESVYVRGISKHESGEYEEAIQYLSSAHQFLSESAGVNYALADAHLSNGDYGDAIYYANLAVEKEPESKWYLSTLAEAYSRDNQDDKAEETYRAILEHHPDDINTYYRLASLHSRNADYEKSNEAYKEIINRAGPQRQIFYQKFQNYSSLEDEEGAIEQLENIRELEPGNLNIIQTLSQYYLQIGESEKAFEAINEALERNPDDPETLVNLADLYLEEEEYEKGGEILKSVASDTLVEHQHKLEIGQFLLSRFASDQDNDYLEETTREVVDTIATQHPDEGHSHVLAAEFYELIEEWENVRYHLTETTKLMPDNSSAWQQRLQALYMEEDYEEAIEVGKEANEHVPDDALIKFFTGSAFLLGDYYEEAVEWLKDAAEMPSRANMRSMIFGSLGDAYSAKDNWEEAREAYNNAIDLDENNDVALNNFAYYMAEENEDLEKAKEFSQRALQMEPENAAYLDTMGWIYFKLGDYEEAKNYIQKSLDTGEASATVKEHMGDVYKELGDEEKARKWWSRALEEDESKTHLEERISGA